MDDEQIPTSENAMTRPAEGPKIEATEELLRLLRAINDKLDAGAKLPEVITVQEKVNEKECWYLNTLPSIDFAIKYRNRELHVPNGYYRFLSEKNRICQLLDRKEKEPDDSRFSEMWRYKYESPFRTWAAESEDIAAKISEFQGKLWAVPDDGRIALFPTPESLSSTAERNQSDILQTLTRLQTLDIEFRLRQDCGFWVIDYDPWKQERVIYGETTGPLVSLDSLKEIDTRDISWQSQDSGSIPPRTAETGAFAPAPLAMGDFRQLDFYVRDITAPWRRLILFSGLGTLPPKSLPLLDTHSEWPYFPRDHESFSAVIVKRMIKQHLTCERISALGSANPFRIVRDFQLVFFETLDGKDAVGETTWKKGELFQDPTVVATESDTRPFRRSAFGVLVCANGSVFPEPFAPLYTTLLLLPDNFISGMRFQREVLSDAMHAATEVEAELTCLDLGLSEVVKRWTSLNEYLDTLIAHDFMEPKVYWKYLFDDESFTLSRKYFWAIGCLGEFIGYISDDIKQWDLYYEARIKPLREMGNLADLLHLAAVNPLTVLDDSPTVAQHKAEGLRRFENLVDEGRKRRDALVNLQTQFENKLETFKSLRDGLFNASALIESRASTRLGQNVKLLTYVSIFYLPLAFCAALWAIPNIQDKSTKIPFVITAILVGFITYVFVFNMDFMTNKLKMWYIPRREYVIKQMQQDKKSDGWKHVGEHFEEFKPSSENKVPTEWWIPVYVTRQLLWKRTWAWKKDPGERGQRPTKEGKQPIKEGKQPEGTNSEEVKAGNTAEVSPKGQANVFAEQEADPEKGKKLSWSRFRRRKVEDPAP